MKTERLLRISEVAELLNVPRTLVVNIIEKDLHKLYTHEKQGYMLTPKQVRRIRRVVSKIEL